MRQRKRKWAQPYLDANEKYVSKAPSNIVESEKQNLEKEEIELKLLTEKINNL